MQCYTELIPPTAVTNSISLSLLSATANNLVVAKSSLLQIFAFKSVLAEEHKQTAEPPTPRQRKERSYITKLVLIGQYQLSGTVTGLGRVKPLRSKSGGELLVVALRDAKLSLVQWDPEKYSIATVSIHYYEREDLQGSPWAPSLGQCVTHLTVDPGNRCAAYKFGVRHLAILPFHQKGDELAIDDLDDPDAKLPRRQSSIQQTNGDTDASTTPYAASFVLSLLTLDPALVHPVHLAFLYGYREPTLGVLSSQLAPSSSLLPERRDPLTFTLYTLDLEQRASTSLASLTGLPYDMTRIIPFPAPIGGALLVGTNQLIHVDQSGKAIGVAVNEFAQQATDYPLISQSDLGLKLEGCALEQLSGSQGQTLLILNDGRLALVDFQTDGRTVSNIHVEMVSSQNGSELLQSAPSCTSVVGRGRIFVGSEDSDSVVLGWSSTMMTKRRGTEDDQDHLDLSDDLYSESEDENDLYADSSKTKDRTRAKTSGSKASASEYSFKTHDSLMNLAPLRSLRAMQSCFKDGSADRSADSGIVDLVASTGNGKSGALTRLRPELALDNADSITSDASRVWALHVKRPSQQRQGTQIGEGLTNVLVACKEDKLTFVYEMPDAQELSDTDFESEAGAAVEMGVLAGGTRILQVLPAELRLFDGDFSLIQIVPLFDDNSESSPKVIAASIAEPFVLLLRDDHGISLLRINDAGDDIADIAPPDAMMEIDWQSGALFDDADDAFHLPFEIDDIEDVGTVLMFLLGRDGSLHIFRPPSLQQPLYVAGGLSFLPPYLTADFTLGRGRARASLTEILVAHLGDTINQSPYLILRTADDEVILYQPYQDATKSDDDAVLRFFRTCSDDLPRVNEEAINGGPELVADLPPLRTVQLASGLATVWVPGVSPRLVVKTAACEPKIIGIKSPYIRHLSGYTMNSARDSILAIDKEKGLQSFYLPLSADISTGWVTQKLYTAGPIVAFDHHPPSNRLILATSASHFFRLPQDDELHPEWREETTGFLPQVEHDTLQLLDPTTRHVTDTYELDSDEIVLCLKVLLLEVSEVTRARRDVVCVGTAIARGEDLLTQGCIYVFDVIKVVPEPGRPDTGRRLKLLAKVKDRGAVTAVSAVGNEGFLLVAHGQKCHVRGLKEDGTLLPVAFMDTQSYVSVAKELRGTNLIMMGDAIKGLWFVGYTEDPYALKLFGKGAKRLEIAAAEYLPDGEDLFIVAIDGSGMMHTYKFDPTNPKSLTGQRLLLLSNYNTGSYPTSAMLLPRTPSIWDALHTTTDPDVMDTSTFENLSQILVTTSSGSLALLVSLSPNAYRTLAALQSYLTQTLPHPLGLNPKAYRAADADLSIGGRVTLDGSVLRRWVELGSWKRAESIARSGLGGDLEIRALLEGVGFRGMKFL